MALDANQLLGISQGELDAVFSAHEAGPVPDGEAAGTAIIAPGTMFSHDIAAAINIFVWKGKVFDAKAGFLRNEILPFGLKAIVARVYKAPSWLDGKECIVLDYSETSLVASHVRDEIRLVDERLLSRQGLLGLETADRFLARLPEYRREGVKARSAAQGRAWFRGRESWVFARRHDAAGPSHRYRGGAG